METMLKPVTLLIPEKTDAEFEDVFSVWMQRGGTIKRLGKYWIKDEALAKQPIAIYGNQTFSLVLAQIYNVTLISPDDTLIARLDRRWTKRNVTLKQVGQMMQDEFPVFIKSVIPKLFVARIFQSLKEFGNAVKGLQLTEEMLVSDIVQAIRAEARSFVKDGMIMDIALYEGAADLGSGKEFMENFIANNKAALPEVVVIDIAYDETLGWFVLEFNACWGAGLNNCNAALVMDCIIGATKNA